MILGLDVIYDQLRQDPHNKIHPEKKSHIFETALTRFNWGETAIKGLLAYFTDRIAVKATFIVLIYST